MSSQHEQMLNKIRKGAEDAFGQDGAANWLNKKWRIFDQKTPLEMADTDCTRVLDFIHHLNAEEQAARQINQN